MYLVKIPKSTEVSVLERIAPCPLRNGYLEIMSDLLNTVERNYDIIVVGGGILGVTLSYWLSTVPGLKIALIEAFYPMKNSHRIN